MRASILGAAMAVIARTAGSLALAMPAPLQEPGWPGMPGASSRKPAGKCPAGSKLARMAREGRVGVSKPR